MDECVSKLSAQPNLLLPVYKEECVYSFDSPEFPETGLYVSLSSYLAVGHDHLQQFVNVTNEHFFLNYRRVKTVRASPEEEPSKKPCKLGIGIEGGFSTGSTEYESEDLYRLYLYPSETYFELDDPKVPEKARVHARHIMSAQSPKASSLPLEWDGEERRATNQRITQINAGKTIPAQGWKCERCDLTSNLWLNLTSGAILCGRKFFDGSGGNNHAVDYYNETKYPLAVKLGTITASGRGDVFSYPEDDMVEDPLLKEHLAHFGIDVEAMKKTEKTVAELEVEINQTYEWKILTESEGELERLFGPEFTGMRNMGNTCYIASVMQSLSHIIPIRQLYVSLLQPKFTMPPRQALEDVTFQMCKLFNGLHCGKYSTPGMAEAFLEGITPSSFKRCVGGNHPEFRTGNQQDAQEFMLYLFTLLERASQKDSIEDIGKLFQFTVQERIQCSVSKCVKYDCRNENMLSLFVPMEECINRAEVEEYERSSKALEQSGQTPDPSQVVIPKVPLSSLLTCFIQQQTVTNFRSTAANALVDALKSSSLLTFPKYLLVHVRRFGFSADWRPNKLQVSIDMPESLDLGLLRSPPRPSDEQPLPGDAPTPPFQYNEDILVALQSMGFHENSCKRACFHTANAGPEQATNWLMEHMDDPDFTAPFTPPGAAAGGGGGGDEPPEDSIAMVQGMGFTRIQAINALKNTNNDIERSVDWIFSHLEESNLPPDTAGSNNGDKQRAVEPDLKPANYKLLSFISHMGPSALCGHYVAHIKIDGQWVLFNDEKVAVSTKVPKDLGYIYIYERIE